MAFILSRNAKLYVSTVESGFSTSNTYRVEVLDGFSFPSAATSQDITVSEAGATPVRGQQSFTTSIDPVEWSFSSYVRPYADTTVQAPELMLWSAMVGPFTSATDWSNILTSGNAGAYGPSTGSDLNFSTSNVHQIQKLFLYFDMGGTWYKISNAVVDTAEFDFGIDQIAMIAWSGKADSAVEITDPSLTYTDLPTSPVASFLQNKLSTVEIALADSDWGATDGAVSTNDLTSTLIGDFAAAGVVAGDFVYTDTDGYVEIDTVSTVTITATGLTDGSSINFSIHKSYTLALTGGNLSVSNNITFLTPESLGVINTPLDHFTGTRSVSGSMTAYLKTGGASDTGDLYNKLAADTSTITQNARVIAHVGGALTADTQVEFKILHAHLVVPTINIEDVVAVNIDFTGLPYGTDDFDLEATNELAVTYRHV